jgi:hypothetical protein
MAFAYASAVEMLHQISETLLVFVVIARSQAGVERGGG